MKTQTFEEFLDEHFVGMNVYGETPITKDNVEDLFVDWFSNLQMDEVIALADLWMDYFKKEVSKAISEETSKISVDVSGFEWGKINDLLKI